MRFGVVMRNMRQVFTGNAKQVRQIIVSGGHNDLAAFVAIVFTLGDARKNGKMPTVSLDALDALIEPQFEAIVFRGLSVVFERFIPGWFFASTCKRQVPDFEELGSGEEQHVGRIVVVNCSSSCRRAEVASSSFFFQTKKSFAPRVTRTARLFSILNEGGARRRKPEFASAPRSAAQFPATTTIAFSYKGKLIIWNPEAVRRSRTEICAGVNSTIAALAMSRANGQATAWPADSTELRSSEARISRSVAISSSRETWLLRNCTRRRKESFSG